MDRDQLIAEIKLQLQEELKHYTKPLTDKIPDSQKQKANQFKNEMTELVKVYPLEALGIAILAGFFIGRLFYKRKGD